MHYCDDGHWRILKGGTLREHGFEGDDFPRICAIHSCAIEIVKTFSAWSQVEDYFKSLMRRE